MDKAYSKFVPVRWPWTCQHKLQDKSKQAAGRCGKGEMQEGSSMHACKASGQSLQFGSATSSYLHGPAHGAGRWVNRVHIDGLWDAGKRGVTQDVFRDAGNLSRLA